MKSGDKVRITKDKFTGQTGEIFGAGDKGVAVIFPHSRIIIDFPHGQVEPLKVHEPK